MKRIDDTDGLARHLKIRPPTVRAWVRLTDIPTFRIGRLVRFDLDAVEKWIEAGGASQLAPAMKRDAERREGVGITPRVRSSRRGRVSRHGA